MHRFTEVSGYVATDQVVVRGFCKALDVVFLDFLLEPFVHYGLLLKIQLFLPDLGPLRPCLFRQLLVLFDLLRASLRLRRACVDALSVLLAQLAGVVVLKEVYLFQILSEQLIGGGFFGETESLEHAAHRAEGGFYIRAL